MIGLAQIGVGYWGGNLLRSFNSVEGGLLRRICDDDSAKSAKLARQYPNAVITSDFRDLLKASDVDAVAIATPAPTHYDLARAFLEAGKHVFVEKPFVLDLGQAEELTELAARKNLVLMVGHLLLYHPAYVELKRRVALPEFGDLRYVVSERASLGIIRTNENVMWSFAPHDIALALFLINETPCEIQAMGQAYMQRGIEDVCFLTLRFPSGRMAQIHVSWMFPRKVRLLTAVGSSQMIQVDDAEMNDKMAIFNIDADGRKAADAGSGGYADRYQYETITFKRGDTILPRISGAEPLKLECQHFVDCIKNGSEPVSSGRASLDVVRILAEADRQLRKARGDA
ncbi:MAG: Gfo/Idh/MocA family oxidoreductase [Alphaproteobacteria bacterium]|nr:Gfo/Idh/MocA family oxidoreductase [Alphaproteobacteria bacterium]